MYIISNSDSHKCSKCGSLRYESVKQFNERLLRCRDCGHEGSRQQVIPMPTTTDTAAIYVPPEDADVRALRTMA